MSKTGKFAAVCAGVLVAGLVIGAAGYALGGVRGFDKLADKHDWIQGTPGDRVIIGQTVDSYDSVELTGNADVYLITEEYYKDQAWLDKHELLSSTEADSAGDHQVVCIKGEKVPDPEISVQDGVLKIHAKEKNNSGLNLNFSMNDWTPKVLICCPKEELQSIRTEVDTGDIVMGGISYKKAIMETDTGDISAQKTQGESLAVKCDTGDISLGGEVKDAIKIKTDTGDIKLSDTTANTVEITSDTGDIFFEAKEAIDNYSLDLHSDTGDVVITESGKKTIELDDISSRFTRVGGSKKLTFDTDTGDIHLSFGK